MRMALPYSEYDDELLDEPLYPYTTEVGDLFKANLVAELEIQHKDCDFLRAPAERRDSQRCNCSSIPYYYIGRRADREQRIMEVIVAGPCESLVDLERLCKERIYRFRKLAREQNGR
jgi:hypothetical protein